MPIALGSSSPVTMTCDACNKPAASEEEELSFSPYSRAVEWAEANHWLVPPFDPTQSFVALRSTQVLCAAHNPEHPDNTVLYATVAGPRLIHMWTGAVAHFAAPSPAPGHRQAAPLSREDLLALSDAHFLAASVHGKTSKEARRIAANWHAISGTLQRPVCVRHGLALCPLAREFPRPGDTLRSC